MKRFVLTILTLAVFVVPGFAQVANSSMEVENYRDVDGKIILDGMLNGKAASFLLDLSGHNAILREYLDDYGIDPNKSGKFRYSSYLCRNVEPSGSVSVGNVTIGNGVSGRECGFFVLDEDAELKKLGVVGTLDATIFRSCVLTIDADRKKITMTAPYRPSYMKLSNRQDMTVETGSKISFEVIVDGKPMNVIMDTRNSAGLVLAVDQEITQEKKSVEIQLANNTLSGVSVGKDPTLKRSALGLEILKKGILSMDFDKGRLYFQPHGMVAIDDAVEKAPEVVVEEGKLNAITRDYFIENIFDYRQGGEFKSKSDRIIVIDFWATWCGPCMRLLPEMEKMAAEFKGKVLFLKVNADKEKELCNVFGIQALPTLMFIAPGKDVIRDTGALPAKYREIIKSLLK